MLGENDVLAYLVMMAPRLVELHRVLKPTGSLYLHCDPTASHYLKLLLDAVFGPTMFRNEVIWKRTGAHGGAKRFGPVHDVLLFVTKGDSYTWNQPYRAYEAAYVKRFSRADPDGRSFQDVALTGSGVRKGESGLPWRGINPTAIGRHWAIPREVRRLLGDPEPTDSQEALDRLDAAGFIYWPKKGKGVPRLKEYLDVMLGQPVQDIISDIPPVNSQAAERLGYPTQKPVALLERIISASSNEGDLVLDPFCGCGTTVAAAQALNRCWTGIDITYIAIDLIRRRLEDTYKKGLDFEIDGIPRDLAGAEALFRRNPFDFERWAVSLVYGQPNDRQRGDRGFDGVIRFPVGKTEVARVLVSVKGGRQIGPNFVNELQGTVSIEKAEMGVLITLAEPTRGMIAAANHSGSYVWPVNNRSYPKLQLTTIRKLLQGQRVSMPPALSPYISAARWVPPSDQLELGGNGA